MLTECFARTFSRNPDNIALPVVVCPGVRPAFKDGGELEVDIDSGVVKNLATGKALKAEALPPNIQHIRKQAGLVEVAKVKLAAKTGLWPFVATSRFATALSRGPPRPRFRILDRTRRRGNDPGRIGTQTEAPHE